MTWEREALPVTLTWPDERLVDRLSRRWASGPELDDVRQEVTVALAVKLTANPHRPDRGRMTPIGWARWPAYRAARRAVRGLSAPLEVPTQREVPGTAAPVALDGFEVQAVELVVDGGPTPEAVAVQAETAGEVFNALAALSAVERAVVRLRWLDERTRAEAAVELGITPWAVHDAERRARTALRARLAELREGA